MAQALTFGAYIPGQSAIHRLNAQAKIVLACAFSIGIFFVEDWVGLAIIAALTFACYVSSSIPFSRALSGLAPIAFILVFTVVAHLATGDVLVGCFIALRIVLLFAFCSLLTFTTTMISLTDGLLALLLPLRRLHLPVDDLAMVVSLALRFIPTTAEEAHVIQLAHKARGARFRSGSLYARTKAWGRMLILLVVSLFSRADKLALAMDARSYRGQGRTHYHASMVCRGDIIVLVVGLVFVVVLCIVL